MNADFKDILERAGDPDWYDMNGVPRYGAFHPDNVSNIYATHVAFLLIECQACGRPFRVAVHCDKGYEEMKRSMMGLKHPEVELPQEGNVGWFHYGDPPRHASSDRKGNEMDCLAGDTMNSVPVQVLEFWVKEDVFKGWVRRSQYEVDVRPDWAMGDTE